jgi:predicted acylesterase/phospholipase RssA
MTPRQLCTAFIEGDGPDRIDPSLFIRPALGEYAARALMLPRLAAQALLGLVVGRRSLLAAIERLGRALPAGLFSHEPLQRRLHEVFSAPGRSDDFRHLGQRLVVVATDLDSGEAAPFGRPGWDQVPVSRAVAASAALPGLFPPVPIHGAHGRRWYVDGALKKTLHARVLLDMGLDLVLALNPLVPFDATQGAAHRVLGSAHEHIPRLVNGGLPVVLSQTFRTLIHSRLELGLKGYETSHPCTDILLFEPDHRDPELFLANIFGYSQRRSLAEHAYQSTRADLRSRRSVLKVMLARHGLALSEAALDDPTRRLLGRPRAAGTPAARTLRRLDEVLADLERALAARG